MTSPEQGQSFWGEYKLPADETNTWVVGPTTLFCKRRADELWVSSHTTDEANKPHAEIVDTEPTWSRWVISSTFEAIRFTPLFPDRAVVVKPEFPFRISVGGQARIYVRVPLWLQIEALTLAPTQITSLPLVSLPSTWFGSFTDGELAYWISSSARRQVEPDLFRNYLAIAPIHIENKSEEELHVEKLCLRVEGLSLFDANGQLWADETRVHYRGSNDISRIELSGKPPAEATAAHLISSPRSRSQRGFAARTFSRLKDLPGLGVRLV